MAGEHKGGLEDKGEEEGGEEKPERTCEFLLTSS